MSEIIIRGVPVSSSYSHKEILASIFKRRKCDFIVESTKWLHKNMDRWYNHVENCAERIFSI